MNIAVCSSGHGDDKEILLKSRKIGSLIAKTGNILLTGGGTGYPLAALMGNIGSKGKAACYSPAKDKEEHESFFKFSIIEGVDYIFTGRGIPGRNYDLVYNSGAIIIIGGRIGSLNEFTAAFALNRKIGILNGSGGIVKVIPEIVDICQLEQKRTVHYSEDPKRTYSLSVQVISI